MFIKMLDQSNTGLTGIRQGQHHGKAGKKKIPTTKIYLPGPSSNTAFPFSYFTNEIPLDFFTGLPLSVMPFSD